MLRSSICLAPCFLLGTIAQAQSPLQATPAPGTARNAGIYHVGTGTWTRTSGGAANLGPDVAYSNTALTGYFADLNSAAATGDFSIFDEGRIPSVQSGVVLADRTDYLINGIEFAYCTDRVGPNVDITFNLYESYNPCDTIITNPGGSSSFTLAGTVQATGLPGSSGGGLDCWTLTLDLAGAGEFCLESDGGDQFPGFDGDLTRDSFGIEWIFNHSVGTSSGPLLAGNPEWTPSVAGALLWGGSGTYYDNTGMTACGDTGLDTQDLFAVDNFDAPIPPGCYFFGGYLNNNGCAGPQARSFSSFSTVLYAGPISGCKDIVFSTFCEPAGTNSSGSPASISATPTAIGAGARLDVSDGPQLANSGFGFFLVSNSTSQDIPIGDGSLCLGFPVGRYFLGQGGPLSSLGKFDSNGSFENLAGTSTTGFGFDLPTQLPAPLGGNITPGSTWHFQLWYRDVNPTPTFNFSNGVSLQF